MFSDYLERIEIPVAELVFSGLASGPGDGRCVLLLHGFPQTSWSWRNQLQALAQAGHRGVAIDQRGYSAGARPAGVEHYAMAHLVSDVVAVADRLGCDRFDVVGHDWGGAVAWNLAGCHPDRVRTLTVVSTPHPAAFAATLLGGSDDQAQRSSYMAFFRQPEVPEQSFLADGGAGLRTLFEASGLAGEADEYVSVLTQPGAMTAALNWYRAVDIADVREMGAVTSPTLYVWSTEDVALGRAAAEATAAHVSGPYRFEVLEGVSHWVPEAAPADLNRLLLEHLAAHPCAGGALSPEPGFARRRRHRWLPASP